MTSVRREDKPAVPEGWRPKMVALDIDGTLLKWIEGLGATHEEISPAVHDAVHRALAGGAHIVLASGRSPHGMTGIADMLELHGEERDRLWVVASNGAVVFRYPPLEVVHEETFDARPAVAAHAGAPPQRAGGGRGARHRLPGDQALPRGRAVRRDDRHRRRRRSSPARSAA